MKLATLDEDGWELASAAEQHAQHPTTFWIPDVDRRRSLQRGQGVKLLFDIASPTSGERQDISRERMWVVVSGRVGGRFVGRLVTEPASVLDGENHYLRPGAEIPFDVEHVADIDDPPKAYADRILSEPPVRRWRRDDGR